MARSVDGKLRLAARASIMAGTALWAACAFAEDAPAPDPAAPPPTAAPAATNGAGDIIVTAQRRSERLRDVPISITALSGEALHKQGVVDVHDLIKVVPGLEIPVYGNFVQFAIRGISSQGAGLGDSSNVALYVDGVYQASEQSQTVDFPDVENIQVLKGPQGTLYGQNAVGGAILITTLAPSFTLKGRVSAIYGNYNDRELRGYVTGPLSNTIAVLLSGSYQRRTGFRKDLLRGGHNPGLRADMVKGKILFQPNSDVGITLTGFWRKHDDSNSIAGFPLKGNTVAYGLADIFGLVFPRAGKKSFAMDFGENGGRPDAHLTNWGGSMNGVFKTGIGTFNTVTAFYKTAYHSFQDVDFSALEYGQVDLPIKGQVFIQEVNFVSQPIGPVTITAGASYMHRKESYTPQLYRQIYLGGVPKVFPFVPQPPFFTIGGRSDMHKDSYAGYLEADWKITDNLTLTAGGRYTSETSHYATENIFNVACGCNIPYQNLKNSPATFHKFTPHAVVRYRFNDGTNIYFSWTNGFKNGFLNATDVNATPVKPETVEAFEVGYKGRPLPGVALNIAAFYYNYKKLQVFIYDPENKTGKGSHYENAGSAKIYGLDGDISIKLGRDFTLNAGAAWIPHANYGNYPNASDLIPIYLSGNSGDTLGNLNFSVPNAKGMRIIRAAKLSASATLTYVGHLPGGDLDAMVAGHYNSGYKYDVLGFVRQKAYGTMDAEIGYSPNGIKGLRVAGWIHNLTNTYYLESELNSTVGNTAAYAPPRTFGGKIEFAF